MLPQQDKKELNQMQADLMVFKGKVTGMQVTNGEGPVFDDVINDLNDTLSSLRRVMNKLQFNS